MHRKNTLNYCDCQGYAESGITFLLARNILQIRSIYVSGITKCNGKMVLITRCWFKNNDEYKQRYEAHISRNVFSFSHFRNWFFCAENVAEIQISCIHIMDALITLVVIDGLFIKQFVSFQLFGFKIVFDDQKFKNKRFVCKHNWIFIHRCLLYMCLKDQLLKRWTDLLLEGKIKRSFTALTT